MLTIEKMPGTISEGKCFSSDGKLKIHGETLSYHIDAQEFIFEDTTGRPEASFFAFSHFRTDGEKKESRPVLFVYEGGPGASSAELYLGLFGPHTIKIKESLSPVPPYQLEENMDSLLDICDIVMVDPPGTGFARIYEQEAASKYWSAEGDAAASRKFISFWLRKYGRWNSPKYICGKSYGGMRAAIYPYYFLGGSTDPQLGQFGIGLNGTIILCDPNVGNFQSMEHPRLSAPDQPPELNLIATFAAIHHYHHPEGKPELRAFIDAAHNFAYTEYARALLAGESISKTEAAVTAKKLSGFTGLSEDFLLAHELHLDIRTFASVYMAAEGKDISLYDGRFTRDKIQASSLYDSSSDDPMLISLWTCQVSLMQSYMKEQLGIDWNREYHVQNYEVGWNWDFSLSGHAAVNDLLRTAAARNPGMHIFIGKGIYDCVTPIGDGRYTLNHYHLPKERITYKECESGHALWLGKGIKKSLSSELREFILKSGGRK